MYSVVCENEQPSFNTPWSAIYYAQGICTLRSRLMNAEESQLCSAHAYYHKYGYDVSYDSVSFSRYGTRVAVLTNE